MKFEKINKTTYVCNNLTCDIPVETVIGDEKQAKFYPRLKIKKWDNEVNLSVGLIDNFPGATKHILKNHIVEWKKPGITARFYPIKKAKPKKRSKPTRLRYIKCGYVDPMRISSGHELNRHIDNKHPTITSAFPDRSCLVHYGFYPAEKYLDLSKVDIPQIRISTYPAQGNPMYFDRGLAIIDINYTDGLDDKIKMEKTFHNALEIVLKKYNIDLITNDDGSLSKRYIKHNKKLYKVISTSFTGGHYGSYLNLGCDYNKSISYYRDGAKLIEKEIEPVLCLRTLNKDIPDSIVDEIVYEYSKLCGLPVFEEKLTEEEQAVISNLASVQSSQDWILNARRSDVWQIEPGDTNKDGFEFEVELDSKPPTNVLEFSIRTKNLKFYYQPELTIAEKYESFRPPKVIGSYAVYHESKKNNEYMTGKICHIYRPWAADSEGNKVWCDLSINESEQKLLITIPQEFINTAAYPIIIDPDFGYTTPGGSNESIEGYIRGTVQTTPSESGSLNSISMYLDTALLSGGISYKGAVYSTAGGGPTYDLIAECTAEGTEVGVDTWRTLNFAQESVYQSTDYVLCAWGLTDGGGYTVIDVAFDEAGSGSKWKALAYPGAWPNPITWGGSDATARNYSIYVNYTGDLNAIVTDGTQMKPGVRIYTP